MKKSEQLLTKIEQLQKELEIVIKNEKPHWVVVVDDSNCTCGVGGEGYMWVASQSPRNSNWYDLKKNEDDEKICVYSYGKEIFRDATEEEVKNWKKDKTRAKVTPHGKPRLCENIFGKLDEMFNGLVKK